MIQQKVRKVGNSLVVTIPRDEADRLGLREGDLVSIDVVPLDVQPRLRPELEEILEEIWERNEAAFRYLADR